jgi:hypothetical protein
MKREILYNPWPPARAGGLQLEESLLTDLFAMDKIKKVPMAQSNRKESRTRS